LLSSDDRQLVDEVFQVHLPRSIAERTGAVVRVRSGQHGVASAIAESFGARELLLVHAPTGTGKTLAYLIPTLLWSLRNGVRVGVATYTRALQEQAYGRDVPLALDALRRAGITDVPRVCQLKGRANYLCWRALRLQAPTGREDAAELLAWTQLTLFALIDEEGDLDRLQRRLPLLDRSEVDGTAALSRIMRLVRAESGCCAFAADRRTCAADRARKRAEHAHLVITNQAYAMARREMFRHLVIDECEHLHDVAHAAYSHAVSLRELRELLARLHRPGARRTPLVRVAQFAVHASPAWAAAQAAIQAREDAGVALDRLGVAIQGYRLWREDREPERDPADAHSLFREYALTDEADPLREAQSALAGALNELAASLALLAEHLEELPTRGVMRIRRSLDVQRIELGESLAGVEAWIPRNAEGQVEFRLETFYDLESTPSGDDRLLARVLLPHEYLGRRYFPDLHGAVLISATTWLQGGFDAQARFLGVARATQPAEDEGREPCRLRTFRAPEAFDYRQVLLALPRDAPDVRESKLAYLDWVARFLGYLGERTHGRLLALFTNAEDVLFVGRALAPFFAARRIAFWYQGQDGAAKEELSDLFRLHTDSVLLGLDTFWYGADFPGPTLEYLVIVRLPYGVPDRYHHAQCAALGPALQRKHIYLPRALAKFRQGFGRLMRTESDRGVVFVLDGRLLDPRHRAFLRELPVQSLMEHTGEGSNDRRARWFAGDTDRCVHEALAHMDVLAEMRARGLERPFAGWRPNASAAKAGEEGARPA
jgi:ATP-dependent DNA helicase DinG